MIYIPSAALADCLLSLAAAVAAGLIWLIVAAALLWFVWALPLRSLAALTGARLLCVDDKDDDDDAAAALSLLNSPLGWPLQQD